MGHETTADIQDEFGWLSHLPGRLQKFWGFCSLGYRHQPTPRYVSVDSDLLPLISLSGKLTYFFFFLFSILKYYYKMDRLSFSTTIFYKVFHSSSFINLSGSAGISKVLIIDSPFAISSILIE